ncbi:DUF3905 domain-containing protein [Paenibacillus sp. N3.4]|uniref:DUF3905 domain-containing protein n=1 Tax=Paenibacillus sp. N3.4 TaxID=2603222 RepID=UPI0011C8A773|nr:DUF3905 domain-containing protein [Paenibacillus sp. N3.4]TXK82671.1 DUF3905 domain-containing protein [Paenibacillus sp. N3.4]
MSSQEQNQPTKATQAKQNQSDLDPFEINFLPQFEQGRGPHEAFVNEYDVVIGDHDYESANSPLEQWTAETDPVVMAGDGWVHPYKDIGFQSAENRDIFERGIPPQSGIFTHPDKNVAYDPDESTNRKREDEAEA